MNQEEANKERAKKLLMGCGTIIGIIVIVVIIANIVAAISGDSDSDEQVVVGYLPSGWVQGGDYEAYDSSSLNIMDWAMVSYSNNRCDLEIYYGETPSSLKGNNNDKNSLIRALNMLSPASIEYDETGILPLPGDVAAYRQASISGVVDKDFIFASDKHCVVVDASYPSSNTDCKNDVVDILGSIYFE